MDGAMIIALVCLAVSNFITWRLALRNGYEAAVEYMYKNGYLELADEDEDL